MPTLLLNNDNCVCQEKKTITKNYFFGPNKQIATSINKIAS